MKKEQLSIGDIVLTPDNIALKIRELREDYAILYGGTWFYDELSPLPLTREILHKNGWEEIRPKVFVGGDIPFRVALSDAYPCEKISATIYDDVFIAMRFTHELQHALSLCGYNADIRI